jgi:hypothetical protein
MTISSGFFRFTALVALVAACTTFANTTLPYLQQTMYAPTQGFEQQVLLFQNPLYMARQWVMLLHAIVTLVAGIGVSVALMRRSFGAAIVGLVFTVIEKITELFGQVAIVFTLNGDWRPRYVVETDEAVKVMLKTAMQTFLGIWDDMFVVLWIAYIVSAVAFAIACRDVLHQSFSRTHRFLQIALWSSAVLTGLMLAQEYAGQVWAQPIVRWCYPIIMTFTRAAMALWLWNGASHYISEKPNSQ